MNKMNMKKKIYSTPLIEVQGMDISLAIHNSSPLHTNAGMKTDPSTGDAGHGRSRGIDMFDEDDSFDFDEF